MPLTPVARGVAVSAMPALATSAWAPAFGVLIHLGLAVVLGLALAFAVRPLLCRFEANYVVFAMTMPILTIVWAVNFFVILPQVNPAFVHLLPYGVTLVSKLLFGLAAASVFARRMLRTPTLPKRLFGLASTHCALSIGSYRRAT